MKQSTGLLLIVVGLLLLFIAVTGRLSCLLGFFNCLSIGPSAQPATTGGSSTVPGSQFLGGFPFGINFPQLPGFGTAPIFGGGGSGISIGLPPIGWPVNPTTPPRNG